MDPRRLSRGEWVAGASGLALLVSLFLPWYSVGGSHVSAWTAMAVDDVILAFAGVATLVAAAATAARPGTPVPIAYTALTAFVGVLAIVVTVWRVADPAAPASADLGPGAWVGLVAALGIAGGAWAGLGDEGPARRNPAAARTAAAAGLDSAELLSLPPEGGGHA
ncbi:MAG: hypothetical protein ACJ76Z_11700 [Thermoleophilaceae bacterium]